MAKSDFSADFNADFGSAALGAVTRPEVADMSPARTLSDASPVRELEDAS